MSVYLYTTCSVLTVGCPVYTNDSLTTPAGNGQYYDGATCWTISGGIITGTGACTTTTTSTTTTTTTAASSTNHFRSVTPQTSAANACLQSMPNNIYTSTATSTMAVNIVFYSDSGLTTLFNGNSQWFKILWKGAVGTDDIYAVQINSSGVVLAWEYCPTTTTSTTTTTTTAASVFIDILGDASNQANGSGFITVYATACLAGSQENVNTNVAVDFTWTGDLSSTISGTVTIPAGASCGSGSFGGATIGENVSVFTFDILDPSSSGNQIYQIATVATHGIPSCGC